jgi:hypothetical protein
MNKLNKILTISAISFTITNGFCTGESKEESISIKTKASSPLENLPDVIQFEIFKHISSKKLSAFNRTSKSNHQTVTNFSIDLYAKAVVENKPIATEVKDILNRIPAEDRMDTFQKIANLIFSKSRGIIKRSAPLPPFLQPYFKPVDSIHFEKTLAHLQNTDVFSGAMQYMNSLGIFWVNRFVADRQITDGEIVGHLKQFVPQNIDSYITLENAIQRLQNGQSIPKNIIVNVNHSDYAVYSNQMHRLFLANPTHELVFDFWDNRKVPNRFGKSIPDSVKNVSVVGENLISIGEFAFADCAHLKSINIPNSVTSIGEFAFSGCTSLTEITIPEGVTTIKDHTFIRCIKLASIKIPNSVINIGKFTFSNCISLASLAMPEGITSIGFAAFNNCISIASLTIPEGVTSIGEYAFNKFCSLTSVTISKAITNIKCGSFSGCTRLESLTIPEGVTSIGSYAFWSCTSLVSLTIPNSVTNIGKFALSDCSSLTLVIMPMNISVHSNQIFMEEGWERVENLAKSRVTYTRRTDGI